MTIIRVDKFQDHAGFPIGDAWELLQTQTVTSSVATVDVIDVIGSHVMYKFFWYAIAPASTSVDIWMRTSTDNGGAWDAGASDYTRINHQERMELVPADTDFGNEADAVIELTRSVGNGTNEVSDLEITLFNPSGTEYTKFKWEGTTSSSITNHWHHMGAAYRASAADVTGVRFLMASGNIAQGTLKVYGLNS